MLKRRHIGENLRRSRIQDFGLGNHIEKVGDRVLEMEKQKRRGQRRAKHHQGVARHLFQGNHVLLVAQKSHFGEFRQTEKGSHAHGQENHGIHV